MVYANAVILSIQKIAALAFPGDRFARSVVSQNDQ